MRYLKQTIRLLGLPMATLCSLATGAAGADGTQADSSPSVPKAELANASAKPQSRKLNEQQLAEATARINIANRIVAHVAGEAEAKGFDPSWRVNLLSLLFTISSADLQKIEPDATTVEQAHTLANAARKSARAAGVVAKSLGSTSDNLVFTPKTPCRFIDTRQAGGPITSTRDFDTYDSGPTYGGASGCTLPGIGEPAFVANVTVVVAAGAAGYIGLRPEGSSNTTSFINWPSSGAPSGLANAGIFTTTLESSTGHYEFEVFNGVSSTSPQVILDYFGYFQPADTTPLTCVQTSVNSASLPTGGQGNVLSPACASGYTAVSVSCLNSSGSTGVNLNESYVSSSNEGLCYFNNLSGGTISIYAYATCCQVP